MLTAESLPASMRGEFLGSGCFGRVYRASGGRVVKIARNDMARNWLEYCMWRRESGKDMTLVPVVYAVVDYVQEHGYDPNSYLAVMDEYEEQDRDSPHYSDRRYDDNIIPISGLDGYDALHAGFSEYLSNSGWNSWSPFDDLHGGNIMIDRRRKGCKIVITDPSVGNYYRQSFIHNRQESLWLPKN